MAVANTLPFCSRETFCAVGVLALKNFSQFAVIWAAAPELDPVLELPGAAGDEAAAELDEVEADVLELLLQATTVMASARPSAGARIIRRAKRLNRMTHLLFSVGCTAEGCHSSWI
jgi:hypothetical protein